MKKDEALKRAREALLAAPTAYRAPETIAFIDEALAEQPTVKQSLTVEPAQQQPDELTVWKARAMQAEAVIAKFMEQPAQQSHCNDCGGFDPECPLAQPAQQQEPVAAQCKFDGDTLWAVCSIEHHNFVKSEPERWPMYQVRLLYTSPPATKPFVGLTGEERDYIWHTVGNSDAHGDVDGWSGRDVMDAIETKLREKNA